MKLRHGFALLLLATAPVATAQPVKNENSGRVSYNDKNAEQARHDGDVVELASPTPASHGREFIEIGKSAGEFSEVRIRATEGKVIVRRVRIDFADGTSQVANLDQRLDPRHPVATVRVKKGPRAIDTVVITTDASGKYALQGVFGPGATGVASR